VSPRTIKEKLLDTLDFSLDDVSEERLLDILLDAYNGQKKEVERLRSANVGEALRLHEQQNALIRERRELRYNPLYGASGSWFFTANGQYFSVSAAGGKIREAALRVKAKGQDVVYAAQQMTQQQWEAL
jgi:hypothetical protein